MYVDDSLDKPPGGDFEVFGDPQQANRQLHVVDEHSVVFAAEVRERGRLRCHLPGQLGGRHERSLGVVGVDGHVNDKVIGEQWFGRIELATLPGLVLGAGDRKGGRSFEGRHGKSYK